MVVRTIEMLLEYISIILCIHRTAREKIKINGLVILIFLFEWLMMIAFSNEMISNAGRGMVYIALLGYIKYNVTRNWEKAIKVYGNMIVTIVVLQVILFLILTLLFADLQYLGIYINVISCLIIFWGKEKIENVIITKLNNIKGVLLVILIYSINFFRIFWIFSKNGYVNFEESIRFSLETVVLSLLLILWFHAENNSRHKTKELQMYKMYNQAFEDTITTIRVRQHEFQNHINAIKCMKCTIEDQEELLRAQEQYCDQVLKDSQVGDLLKLKIEPVLVGFLYAKITAAQEAGIHVEYEVNLLDIKEKIEIYEMIELIGILFDNAVEALQDNGNRKMILKLVDTNKGFAVEVANASRMYLNNEIEKFCTYGYSTKGKERGVGLARVKEVVRKANATLTIQNQSYKNQNFLCFRINFEK